MARKIYAKRMRYLLDSNILITLGLDTNDTLNARAAECDADELVTSAIAFAEVVHGSERGKPPPLEKLAILAEEIPVLPFDDNAARAYAMISFNRASYDRLIAAHALSLGLIVVTDNEKDFADVPGLRVENWTV
jgi:tRNA(fMet)-specific endonuclease VapC